MKILLLLLVFCGLANMFCQDVYSSEDNWDTGNYQTEDYPSQGHLLDPESLQTLLRIIRKPGPQQFFGLMGKRSSAKTQMTRKRQKFESFVGLMGKRNLGEQSGKCRFLLYLNVIPLRLVFPGTGIHFFLHFFLNVRSTEN
ncbi:protachykinin [Clupea harengus]|uniref:Protachykinin n=1 Tax=Clupea harengus TaxID=7950 RepID=A0A8M1KGJ8_CLUHA|nr:protachykinin [Clupea harengus]